MKLDETMTAMLAVQLPIQATTSSEGVPDIGPKRSLRVYDGNTLIYNENTGGKTLKNIQSGSKMAVAVIDREKLDGYRFICKPELCSEGVAYQSAVDFAAKNNMKTPLYAVLLHIEEVYSLRSGADAGKKLL